MSDTEGMNVEENITPMKRAVVIKRQKEKLEEEIGGVDDSVNENDEDSDQEFTTKKKKIEKRKDPILDPVFQNRLVRKRDVWIYYYLENLE
jgi:hypothetical protein